MVLTCEEFLKLVTIIKNLQDSIIFGYIKSSKEGIQEKNRRVATAAKNYKEFFNDLKYMQFMEDVRIS